MNSGLIARFVILDCVRLRLRIQMRRHPADYFDRTHAMRNGHHRFGVDALAPRPFAPLPVDRARGIAQNAVEIEQNG